MRKVYLLLLACILFLLPSNLFLKFYEQTAYVNGLLVDYLLPKLYLSDLPILILFWAWLGEWAWKKPKKEKGKRTSISIYFALIVCLTVALFFRQNFADKSLAATWYFIKLVEMSVLGIFLYKKKELWEKSYVLPVVIAVTLLFQSLVGLWQFQTQQSLFPSYTWLGEPHLRQFGFTKGVFGGVEKILPYGTTAHPNILAGFLVVGILLLLSQVRKQKLPSFVLILFGGAILFSILTLFLTQSFSAWFTLILGLIFLFTPRNVLKYIGAFKQFLLLVGIGIAAPFFVNYMSNKLPKDMSLQRRSFLNTAAMRMIIDRPFIGVGLNNFTAQVEQYSEIREVVRFTQPVHHEPLLWLAETGLLGTSLLGVILLYLWKRKALTPLLPSLLILSPILVLDHYLFTQQTGLLMLLFFTLFFATVFVRKRE